MLINRNVKVYFALCIALLFAATMQAQQTPTPQSTPTVNLTPPQIEDAPDRRYRNRVFEIRHRDPESLLQVLGPLRSGSGGTTISASREFRTISLRDFPENIAAIEEALRRLDVPETTRPDIELRIHVLFASNTEGTSNDAPAELRDVIRQLQTTLNYRSYYLATSFIQRTREGARVNGNGSLEISRLLGTDASSPNASLIYSYDIRSLSLAPAAASQPPTVQLEQFSFQANGNIGTARIATSTGVRDGERVVIGTASLRDKALILVLTARVIR